MADFQIIYGPKTEPKETWTVFSYRQYNYESNTYSNRMVWDNPQDANKLVRSLNDRCHHYNPENIAYMLQRLPDPVDFVARECAREDYLPFEVQGKDFHCAELKNGVISFYSSKYNAYDDKRTTQKTGRYLKAYTDMDDNAIADMCARYGVEFGDSKIGWARTREEIAKVYETGPSSCMKGGRGYFGFCDELGQVTHATEAYASPDIAVAYLKREDGRVTARTVVNMIDKQFISIYGDGIRLRLLLEEEGYSCEDATLDGCRLLKIKLNDGDRFACPFLDSDVTVEDRGDDDYLFLNKTRGAWSGEDGYVTGEACRSDYQTGGQDDSYDDEIDYDDDYDY